MRLPALKNELACRPRAEAGIAGSATRPSQGLARGCRTRARAVHAPWALNEMRRSRSTEAR